MIGFPWSRLPEGGLSGGDIVRLRWVWLAAQSAAVALARFGFGVDMPAAGVASVILVGVAANAAAARRPSALTAPLVLDVALLGALLTMAGDLGSPFVALLSVPAFVAAISTVPRSADAIAFAAIVVASLLAFAGHAVGWLAVCAMAGLAAFVGRMMDGVSKARRDALASLAAERSANATGIAFAAAAHEVATPLSTIRVAAAELARELEDGSDAQADAVLIGREAHRCGAIIEAMRGTGEAAKAMPVSEVVVRAAGPHRDRGVEVRIRSGGAGAEPAIDHSAEAILGIRNIVQNAVDFARREVTVSIVWTPETAEVAVSDDGDGFDAATLAGAPPGPGRPRPRGGPGTGSGIALARALLARGGGVVDLGAASPRGARVRVTWRRPFRHG